jgi:transcriptional regulator with XRE-family HTH domain
MADCEIATEREERAMARQARFDGAAFFAALDAQRQAKKLTWRQVAEQSGVSTSTLTRMSQGKLPDVQGLAALSAWAGLDTDAYVRREKQQQQEAEPEPLAMISTYLRSDHNLSPEGAVALEELLKATYERLRKT